MDASQGFYQIQLDEESTQLCTVATPFGRYSFKRLPYEINCAPEIFHAKIQQLFERETGVKVFMDDIVVWGRTREEHDARLKTVLATVRRSGLKLNEKKCVFDVTELTYLGEKLTHHQGIKPDPLKVAGICNMPVPTTKEEVQRALGMVNYMAKFVPNLTVKTTAMRQLLLEKNDWQWEAEQAKEWQDIKDFFTTEPASGSGVIRQNTVSQCCKSNTKYSACHKPFQNRIITRPPGHSQVHHVRVLLIDAQLHYGKMDNDP